MAKLYLLLFSKKCDLAKFVKKSFDGNILWRWPFVVAENYKHGRAPSIKTFFTLSWQGFYVKLTQVIIPRNFLKEKKNTY